MHACPALQHTATDLEGGPRLWAAERALLLCAAGENFEDSRAKCRFSNQICECSTFTGRLVATHSGVKSVQRTYRTSWSVDRDGQSHQIIKASLS